MIKSQNKTKMLENDRNNLLSIAKDLLSYKIEKKIPLGTNSLRLMKDDPFPSPKALEKYGFFKLDYLGFFVKKNNGQKNLSKKERLERFKEGRFGYKLKEIKWLDLMELSYDSILNKDKAYSPKKQSELLQQIIKDESTRLGRSDIVLTEEDIKEAEFINPFLALRKILNDKKIKDLNIWWPEHGSDKPKIKIELLLKTEPETTTLYFNKDGELSNSETGLKYLLEKDRLRYKLLNLLIEKQKTIKDFISTAELAEELSTNSTSIRKSVGTMRKQFRKKLKINGEDIIEGEKGSGYRINYKKCKIKIKK